MSGIKRKRGSVVLTPAQLKLIAARDRLENKRQKRVIAQAAAARQPLNIRTGGLIQRETKYLDTGRLNHNITASVTGMLVDPLTSICLNAVPPGNGASERIGRQISMLHLSLRMTAFGRQKFPPFLTAQVRSQLVRVMIILDKQTNSALTSADDIMVAFPGVTAVTAMKKMENSERFQILYDQTHKIDPPVGAQGATNWNLVEGITLFNIEIPLKGIVVNYNKTGDTYESISDNSLHVAAINSLDDANNGTRISYTARLLYKDQ